jgi:hypothetical protein
VALAITLALGAAQPAHAATAKHLDVVVVERVTSAGYFPPTENYDGSAVGSDQQLWTFRESVVHDHWFGNGPFSMQSGADELSGTVHSVEQPSPVISIGATWSYTVTGGQGAYAGCTGTGTPVRQSATLPLVPPPNGTVVESISFDLTCP